MIKTPNIPPYGIYPNALYRVTVKVLVKNEAGHVLVVWDNDGFWNLPGGGIDHGETVQQAIERELHEELGYEGEVVLSYNDILTYYSPSQACCLMHIIYDATLPTYSGTTGHDAKKAEFIDPSQFKTPLEIAHQFIYKFGYDKSYTIPFDT